MDAVFFSAKRVHLGALRFCRPLLARVGLTPARFDLMVALLDDEAMTQRQLRDVLGVAKSTLSEMLSTMEKIGLVNRTHLCGRRTWFVSLTRRGREKLTAAYERFINGGLVPLAIDRVLCAGEPEIDAQQRRFEFIEACVALGSLRGPAWGEIYMWHPDDYLGALVEPGEPTNGVPFVQ